MRLLENETYQSDLGRVVNLDLPWEELSGKSILISGATGMIGSTLIDVLMALGSCAAHSVPGIRILALGRNEEKAKERFREYWEDARFVFVRCDINDRESLTGALEEVLSAGGCGEPGAFPEIDYLFHAASNTHPVAYANDPIGTIVTNLIGLDNLCAVHLNDSKNERGSRKDRHEKLGQGIIGAEALRAVVRHPLLQDRPFILETPNDDSGYKSEIETVISWMI